MKGQKFESTEDGPATEGKATGAVTPERPGQKETKEGKGEPPKAMDSCWESQWQEVLKTLPSPHAECKYPQLSEAVPWDDAKAFLASFEQVATACRWPREEWAARLLPALSGEAERAFRGLEAGDREDYGKVKAAILRGEALRMEVQRQLFRQFCCREVEDPRRIHSQLQELCRQWLRPERHSKEQILELLILEQFVASLPPDLQGWIRAGGPDSCSQAVALAEHFLMGQQEAETEKWLGLVSHKEAGLGPKRFKGSPAQLDPQTVLQQVLQEEDGHVSSTGDKTGSKDQMDNSLCFRIEPTDTPRATQQIRHAHVTSASEIQGEGSESAEEQGKHPSEQENKCKNHQDDLKGAIGQASMGQTRGHVPVFSKYGRQYHYRAGLDMMPGTEEYNDYPTSEKALQQNSCSGKYQETIPRESKPEFSEHRKVGSFNQDQNNHTEETPYNSPEYGDSFSDAKSLKRSQGIQSEGELYKCTYCDKCFSKSKHLLNHQQCECPESGEIFTFRQALVRNQETYCGVEPYVCSQCGKCFAQKGSLMCHLRIHTGEKPYKCSYCGKSFRQTGALLGHQRIHTGEKPYKCSQCGKSFSYKGNLICHQRIHTGVKPYKCSQCGKCFSQSGHLMSHLRIHNGEKPYRCPLCEKSFSQRGALVNHQKVHLVK